MSQSPQTGQFNSYEEDLKIEMPIIGLNPLKRVNSILTLSIEKIFHFLEYCLNPLKRVNSILTSTREIAITIAMTTSLNPLKRVNSILTKLVLASIMCS